MSTIGTRYVLQKSKSDMRKADIPITAAMSDNLEWPRLRVLGLDPSISSTGWSVVDFFRQQRPLLRAYGTITSDPPTEGKTNMKNIVSRSRIIFDGVRAVANEWPVDVVVVELPIPARAGAGHMGPGSQSGSIAVTAAFNAVPYLTDGIDLVDTTHVKLVVSGDGRADKQVVKSAVTEWLGILPRTNTDVSDSIAATILYALEHLVEMPSDDSIR